MTEQVARPAPFAEYLGHFDELIGDKRTGEAFGEIVRGIINGGSLVCTRGCPISLDVHHMVQDGDMEDSECILCGSCVDGCSKDAIRFSCSVGR